VEVVVELFPKQEAMVDQVVVEPIKVQRELVILQAPLHPKVIMVV
jgi:hypothetical protein